MDNKRRPCVGGKEQNVKIGPEADDEYADDTNMDDGRFTDKPWSFAIGLASFFAQSLLGGFVYTGGLYYTVFTREFPDVNDVAVNWLCTLPMMLWFFGSPVGSIITNRFGCRTSALLGGFIASVGMCLCYFATNFYMLFACYGVLTGLGFGIQYVGFLTAVSRYFCKFRTIVNILSTTGLTVGMAIYSYLVPNLIERYTWNGSLLILGAMTLNLCACACVLFPVPVKTQKRLLFRLSLLRERNFILFCLQCASCNISNALVILHLPSLILFSGHGPGTASLALTLYATSNGVAKVFLGVLGHNVNVRAILVYSVLLTLCGVSTAILPLMSSVEFLLVLVSCIGCAYSVTGGHYFEVVLDLVGHDNFASGIGIAQVAKASGTLIAGPLAGALITWTSGYSASFFTSGSVMLTGCIALLPVIISTMPVNDVQETLV